jgi:hypothetical protein
LELYEYAFVEVKLDRNFLFERTPRENYHNIIRAHADNGWRLVQIFSPTVSVVDGGTSAFYELIFERELEKDSSEKTG